MLQFFLSKIAGAFANLTVACPVFAVGVASTTADAGATASVPSVAMPNARTQADLDVYFTSSPYFEAQLSGAIDALAEVSATSIAASTLSAMTFADLDASSSASGTSYATGDIIADGTMFMSVDSPCETFALGTTVADSDSTWETCAATFPSVSLSAYSDGTVSTPSNTQTSASASGLGEPTALAMSAAYATATAAGDGYPHCVCAVSSYASGDASADANPTGSTFGDCYLDARLVYRVVVAGGQLGWDGDRAQFSEQRSAPMFAWDGDRVQLVEWRTAPMLAWDGDRAQLSLKDDQWRSV